MWIIPTLSRPAQCASLLKNLKQLNTTSKGLVFVNGESHAAEYEKIVILPETFQVYYHTENLGSLGALNHAMRLFPQEPWYGFIGDDEVVHSPGWDNTLIDAAGSWHVSHANDMWQSHRRIHSHVCIGGELARTAGYLAVPECWHWFGFDNMWEEICTKLPLRRWCAGVRAEHKHHLKGESGKDDCYALGESKVQQDMDSFRVWKQSKAPVIIGKIKQAMEESDGKAS